MFVALHRMPAESHEYARQREYIVARCLPLADHVASHFARRGRVSRLDSGRAPGLDERR